jgi:hypothetical protein
MRIYKTIVQLDDGKFYMVDTIEGDGKLWLVPKWLEENLMPECMIRIDQLRPRRLPISKDGKQRADFGLEEPLPAKLLSGSDLGDLAYQYEVRVGDEV